MQAVSAHSLPRELARLWRQHSCVLLQRWQHTVADRPVDPFVAQLQSKTEAELAELLSRHLGEEAPQRDGDADDTVLDSTCRRRAIAQHMLCHHLT